MSQLFKNAYDAVTAALQKVADIAQAIEDHMEAGELEEALNLEPEFDAAKAEADNLASLYSKVTGFDQDKTAARLFTGQVLTTEPKDEKPKQVTRAEFETWEPKARMDFVINRGGIVVDEIREG